MTTNEAEKLAEALRLGEEFANECINMHITAYGESWPRQNRRLAAMREELHLIQDARAALAATPAPTERVTPEQWEQLLDAQRLLTKTAQARAERAEAALAATPAEAEPAPTAFCWLVELFDPKTDNSLGCYHTGFTDLAGQSRSTKDPLKAQRYGSKEAASRAAFRLKFNKVGVWRAVEHGFMARAATPAAPQGYVAVEIYAAWRRVGADVAGLKWDDFVEALRKGKESA